MEEILPGIWHWSTRHEEIDAVVHSAYLAGDPPVVIDARVPEEGMELFRELGPPTDALLTNRHHYRHADRFAEAFGTTVRCHGAGLHEFTAGQAVEAFEFDDVLPGGIEAVRIGVLCPEETGFLVPREGGLLVLGDAVIRRGDELAFVPDHLMGENPQLVKEGLRGVLAGCLDRPFRHLLLAHGSPWFDDGREALRRFVEGG